LQDLLAEAFPRIPLPYIKRTFQQYKFYAPTHIRLDEDSKLDPLPYKPNVSGQRGKGKTRAWSDDEIDKEKAWLAEKLGDSFCATSLPLADGILMMKKPRSHLAPLAPAI